LFKGVLCNFCTPIHENIPLELYQEVLHLRLVPFVGLGQYAFEPDVLVLAFICYDGKVIEVI
jgi:hypothetical protein